MARFVLCATNVMTTNPRQATNSIGDRLFCRAFEVCGRLAGYRVRHERDLDSEATRRIHTAVLGRPPTPIPSDLQHVDDQYERGAAVFVVYHRGVPCGVATLYTPHERSRTLDSTGAALPAGVLLDQILDIGRLAIAPAHRGGARFSMLCLLIAMQRHSERVGRTYWVGATSPGLMGGFRKLNTTLRELELADIEASPDVREYWAAYRGDSPTTPRPFILETNGSSPTSVLGAHVLRRSRLWLSKPTRKLGTLDDRRA